MEIGHEVWQGEGNERAWLWAIDIIRVDIQEYHGEASITLSTVRGSGL
jgi:hypothetical protein